MKKKKFHSCRKTLSKLCGYSVRMDNDLSVLLSRIKMLHLEVYY